MGLDLLGGLLTPGLPFSSGLRSVDALLKKMGMQVLGGEHTRC